MKDLEKKVWTQRLFRVHLSAGIVFSLLMYVAVFFGIFAIVLPYIQVWEKPSRHITSSDITKIPYNTIIEQILNDPNYPKNNLLITLPGTMQESALKISHKFAEAIFFNPHTGMKIHDEGKQSQLASFLNHLHYGKVLDFKETVFGKAFQVFGRLLFGFMAVGVMLVMISGVMLIIYFKFKHSGKNQNVLFSKLHIKVFTWIFPIVLLVTLSGAFMNIGLLGSAPMASLLSSGAQKQIDAVVGPALFPHAQSVTSLNEPAKMMPIEALILKAQTIDPHINFQQIRLINWNDKSAEVELNGYDPYKPFLNGGVFNKPSVTLSAVDGSLIKQQHVMDRSWSVYFAEATFFLHFLFGVDFLSRFLVLLVMVACCVALGFGVMLWLDKQAKPFEQKMPFYHWLGKLSLTVMIGVIPATGFLFNLQWLLPFELEERALWQQGLFYNAWLATLFWSFLRIDSYHAAKEFLQLGGILFITAPLLHWVVLEISPLFLYENKMPNILGVDIGLILLGILLYYSGKKLPKTREDAKLFWMKRR